MTVTIGRRELLIALGGVAAAWPLAARAQQRGKRLTIGYLGPSVVAPWTTAFADRLRELGWIEGRTISIEYRYSEGRPERVAEPTRAATPPTPCSPPPAITFVACSRG
jgi:putative ABC transport system substrate-binding protein